MRLLSNGYDEAGTRYTNITMMAWSAAIACWDKYGDSQDKPGESNSQRIFFTLQASQAPLRRVRPVFEVLGGMGGSKEFDVLGTEEFMLADFSSLRKEGRCCMGMG